MTDPTLTSAMSSADFSIILDQIIALVPIVIPVVLGFVAFKKGFAFVMKRVKGA